VTLDWDPQPEGVAVTVEFLDGERDVPQYFARLVAASGIDFHAVTFEEATLLVSRIGERNYLNGIVNQTIAAHRKNIG